MRNAWHILAEIVRELRHYSMNKEQRKHNREAMAQEHAMALAIDQQQEMRLRKLRFELEELKQSHAANKGRG